MVSGFDCEFNAITGLNGSGKSNILDAICFVLGISNLSQVRAANLQDLVYKQGQAGVTKASVCVVFNNSDASRSPVGYESEKKLAVAREVVIGGRNKYTVNGHSAQASQVANLFHSVQLNVNNPHFLIMQGRITKVLNMKPPEILSMVEEAAGTRMFESKKIAALKMLEKKASKVDEIERVLADDITPTLERLRDEKTRYLRWSANGAELARLERFCAAHEFVDAEQRKVASTDAEQLAVAEVARLTSAAASDAELCEQLERREQEQRAESGPAGAARCKRERCSKDEDACAKACVQAEAVCKSAHEALKGDERAEKDAAASAVEEEQRALDAQKALDAAEAARLTSIEHEKTCAEKVEVSERTHRNACAGADESGAPRGLAAFTDDLDIFPSV